MSTITSRQRVLGLISRRGSASSAQIGRSLSMSPAAVRYHLGVLLRDGRIAYERAEPKRGRGRPEKIYRLSDRLLGDNLEGLTEALLSTWLRDLPAPRRAAALQALGEKLADHAGRLGAGLGATRRLVQLAERLNGLHYQAHWEAGESGPRILLGHCPYSAVIEQHPELCAVDAAFIGKLAGSPVEQLAKIERRPGGATHCIFAAQAARTGRQE